MLRLGVVFEGDEINKKDGKIVRKVMYKNKKDDNQMEDRFYEILHTLEFDSNRKRMSVIIKDLKTNDIILYCKGADTSVFSNSICGNSYKYNECLKSFSENGWRTLVLSYKKITQTEYENYDILINEANNDILNREAKLAQAYNQIEKGLIVIGVTAVEDKLQDNVENTLYSLRQAGIKIWVLTGDKLETAINISESCKHFSFDMNKFIVSNLNDSQEIKESLKTIKYQ